MSDHSIINIMYFTFMNLIQVYDLLLYLQFISSMSILDFSQAKRVSFVLFFIFPLLL